MKIMLKGLNIPESIAQYQGETILRLAEKLLGGSHLPDWIDEELAASLYYAFYLPLPEVYEHEESTMKTEVLTSLVESPSFWRVKPKTVVDRLVSIIASASIIEKLVRNLPRSDSDGTLDSGGEERVKSQVARAVTIALKHAEKDARIAKDIETLIASSIAGRTSELAFEDVLEKILYLSRKTDIERILEKLRGIKLPNYLARRTSEHRRGWIEGIEIGGDPERIHPSQLALPDEVFYILLAESKLLLYRRVFPLEEGPIYVLLDKSGSMQGSKIDWARAVAVALFQRAIRESRKFYIRFFDALPHELQKLSPYSRPIQTLNILEYLGTVKASGGTDITRAIATAIADFESGKVRNTADLILITDGEDKLSENVLQGILRRVKVRLHTVMIGGDNNSLRKVSHSYMTAKTLGGGELIKVIDNVEKFRAVKHRKF